MSMFTRSVMALTGARVVEKTITETRAGRALAGRFVAGDTLAEAAEAAQRINSEGMAVSLDLLGEEVADHDGAERATLEYLESLDAIANLGINANVSVKLTQLGLSIDRDLAVTAVDRLAKAAAEADSTVTIDMEDSRYTQATIDIYSAAQAQHGNLGLCLQAYLRRTPDDLDRLMPLGGHIRLCKGAYVESSDIAFVGRDDVDAAFARLLTVLMASEQVRPAVATHDPRLVELTRQLAQRRSTGFEFQMLFGVRSEEQSRLVGLGHDLRVYLPFGSAWYPYLTRRLAERPANALFFLRSLTGI